MVIVNCQHRSPDQRRCLQGHFGGSPAHGVCEVCPHRRPMRLDREATFDDGQAVMCSVCNSPDHDIAFCPNAKPGEGSCCDPPRKCD